MPLGGRIRFGRLHAWGMPLERWGSRGVSGGAPPRGNGWTRLLAAVFAGIVALTASPAAATKAKPHRDFTSYSVLVEPAPGALLTADGRNLCSFRVDARWPRWCKTPGQWVMAGDIDSRADIRTFAARAATYRVRVVWAPGYTSLDGYAAGFGGVVVIQAEFKQCDPPTYRKVVLAAVHAVDGRVPVLAEYVLGDQGHINCTVQARRSWSLVKGAVDGDFVLDFRPGPPAAAATGLTPPAPRGAAVPRSADTRPSSRVTSKARYPLDSGCKRIGPT